MCDLRSTTRTRLSSWVAARSAMVRPKNPDPTMIRSKAEFDTTVLLVATGVQGNGPDNGAIHTRRGVVHTRGGSVVDARRVEVVDTREHPETTSRVPYSDVMCPEHTIKAGQGRYNQYIGL